MPNALDVINRVHERNLGAATRAQDLAIKVVDRVGDLRGLAPKAPSAVSTGIEKVTAPLAHVLGRPEEFRTYLAKSTRDWVRVQRRFQDAILGAAPAVQEPVVAPKAAKR